MFILVQCPHLHVPSYFSDVHGLHGLHVCVHCVCVCVCVCVLSVNPLHIILVIKHIFRSVHQPEIYQAQHCPTLAKGSM